MNEDYLAKIHEAKRVLCGICKSDMCEWCIVERLVENALNAGDEFSEDEYTPSSTNRDYGPSNPWDAPGMSMSDFIR